MHEDLVTIATFNMAIEADLAKSKLESEGIECFLADEYMLYSKTVGGVKLKVRETDAQRATEILKRSSAVTEDSEDTEPEYDAPRCPRCDSTAVKSQGFSFFLSEKWKCESCGHQWKN